jgi:hypothetical protein
MLESADPPGIDNQAIDQIVTTTLPDFLLDPRYRGASVILSNGNILDICGGRASASTPSTMSLLTVANFASSSRASGEALALPLIAGNGDRLIKRLSNG